MVMVDIKYLIGHVMGICTILVLRTADARKLDFPGYVRHTRYQTSEQILLRSFDIRLVNA